MRFIPLCGLLVLAIGCSPEPKAEVPPPAAIAITPEVAAKLRELAFQATREGDTKTLDEYFAAKQPVNEKNKRGDTLLTVAAYNGQLAAVERILAQPGVEIDTRNGMGLTALTAAAFKGHVDIAKALLRAGADANAANRIGQTSLMFASLSGKLAAVECLLDAGADPAAKDKYGNTALSQARTQGAEDVVARLEKALAKRPE